MPTVTVLMSVYNSEKYLAEAIDSILDQTLTDFEFLIIDDASTDSSINIINTYDDGRIRMICNQENLGLTKSLNKGIKSARGKYIARMDADDISCPTRLKEQMEFMEAHSEVGICGAWYERMDTKKIYKVPSSHSEILLTLWKHNAIPHPTAIFRRETIQKYNLFYDESYTYAQDYALWVKASTITNLANIPKVLLKYRIHNEQISMSKLEEQRENNIKIKLTLARQLLGDDSEMEVNLLKKLTFGKGLFTIKEVKQINEWLLAIKRMNESKKLYDGIELDKILMRDWQKMFRRIGNYNLMIANTVIFSPFFSKVRFKEKVKFFLKFLKLFNVFHKVR